MKIQKSNKKSFLKKIFIKICRILNFEIIDQSDFTVPTLKRKLDENLSISGKKSITIPMGEIKITRQINSLNIIFSNHWCGKRGCAFNLRKIMRLMTIEVPCLD